MNDSPQAGGTDMDTRGENYCPCARDECDCGRTPVDPEWLARQTPIDPIPPMYGRPHIVETDDHTGKPVAMVLQDAPIKPGMTRGDVIRASLRLREIEDGLFALSVELDDLGLHASYMRLNVAGDHITDVAEQLARAVRVEADDQQNGEGRE